MELALQLRNTKELICKLMSAGFDVNKAHPSILDSAVRQYNIEAVKVILPYVKTPALLESAAGLAIRCCSLTIVKLLVTAGAQVDVNQAIRVDRQDILDYLLNAGVPLEGKFVLYRCVWYCTLGTQSFETRTCGNFGNTRQRQELYGDHAAYDAILQKLMAHGAGLDEAYVETGVTALRHSAAGGLVCLTLNLLRAGCNPSVPDNNGRTALQYTLEDCANPFVRANKRRRLTSVAAILTEFVPYFSQEPAAKRILQQAGEDTAGGLPEDLVALLTNNTSAPRSLQHLCRWNLLQWLRPRSQVKVPLLGLPPRLKDYLLLRDLAELNREVAGKLRPRAQDFCFWHRTFGSVNENNRCSSCCDCDPSGLGFVCKQA